MAIKTIINKPTKKCTVTDKFKITELEHQTNFVIISPKIGTMAKIFIITLAPQ